MFILFEGGEGAGKSTQAKALYRYLSRQGFPVVLTKEPGGTPLGRELRRLLKHEAGMAIDPLTELFLFAASRAQLVSKVIRPALEQDKIVICDRFAESTLAYQGYGRGLDLKLIEKINYLATGGLSPDLIFLLDLEVEEGLRRCGQTRLKDRFEQEDLSFHQRVREGYLKMARADPTHWVILDGTQPKAEIQRLVQKHVREVLFPGKKQEHLLPHNFKVQSS